MSEPAWVPLGAAAPFIFRGAWSASQVYKAGDIVTHAGKFYFALGTSTGSTPA